LSEIIRLIDGPLAPFGDADQLRTLIDRDDDRRALYKVFLDVRDAAAKILDGTTLADLVATRPPTSTKSGSIKQRLTKRKKAELSVMPMAEASSGKTGA